jgi:hypothetical protein
MQQFGACRHKIFQFHERWVQCRCGFQLVGMPIGIFTDPLAVESFPKNSSDYK